MQYIVTDIMNVTELENTYNLLIGYKVIIILPLINDIRFSMFYKCFNRKVPQLSDS